MSDKSGIEWTEATWNPATGCTKVSLGCRFCYAKHKAWPRLSKNPVGVYTGRKFEDVQVHPERLDQPLRWTKPRMIFVNSMSDLFHEAIPRTFIEDVFAIMALASRHTFQVLTKRPERMARLLNSSGFWLAVQYRIEQTAVKDWCDVEGRPLPNVWLGTSVENQETADERIPLLLDTPAAVRWLSVEPMLGPVSLAPWEHSAMGDVCGHCEGYRGRGSGPDIEDCGVCDGSGLAGDPLIHWVVCGGESGTKARPMQALWAQNLRTDCMEAEVPFFMKQGSQANWPNYHDFDSFPAELQVREYPADG